jgi:hypothetical protein
MRKLVLVALLFFVSCMSSIQFAGDSFIISLPSDWEEGLVRPGSSYLTIITYPAQDGISLDTIRTDVENSMQSPEMTVINENTLRFVGRVEKGLADIVVSVDGIVFCWRDVQIEKMRLQKTGMKAHDQVIEELALGHVREMAFVTREAKEQNITIPDDVLQTEIQRAYSEAEKKGLPKNAFLANWGVSEAEFAEIIRYKLINEKVLFEAARNVPNPEELDSFITKYLLELESKYKTEDIAEGKITKQIVKVVKNGQNFAIITGGVYADSSESEISDVMDKFEFTQGLPSGRTNMFSKR